MQSIWYGLISPGGPISSSKEDRARFELEWIKNKSNFFFTFYTFQNSDAELSAYRLRPLHSATPTSHLQLYIWMSYLFKYVDIQNISVIILGVQGPFIFTFTLCVLHYFNLLKAFSRNLHRNIKLFRQCDIIFALYFLFQQEIQATLLSALCTKRSQTNKVHALTVDAECVVQ